MIWGESASKMKIKLIFVLFANSHQFSVVQFVCCVFISVSLILAFFISSQSICYFADCFEMTWKNFLVISLQNEYSQTPLAGSSGSKTGPNHHIYCNQHICISICP